MTDRQEWRSGDVKVTRSGLNWFVWVNGAGADHVPRWLFRDPQALAEAVEAQRQQRYYVGEHESATGLPTVYDRRDPTMPVAAGWTAPMAERICALLNADEADQ